MENHEIASAIRALVRKDQLFEALNLCEKFKHLLPEKCKNRPDAFLGGLNGLEREKTSGLIDEDQYFSKINQLRNQALYLADQFDQTPSDFGNQRSKSPLFWRSIAGSMILSCIGATLICPRNIVFILPVLLIISTFPYHGKDPK